MDSAGDSVPAEKSLLATTILVAGASVAAAEVTLSGSARMGVVSGFDDAATAFDESTATFSSRARVSFGLSGQTDGGLSFGASFRADNAAAANNGQAGSVYIEANGIKLEMGDLDSAAQAIVGHVDGVGYTGNQDLNEIVYLSNVADPSAMISYSAGGLTVGASVDNADGADVYSVAISYSMDNYTFSAGIESAEAADPFGLGAADLDHVVLGADATFGNVTVKARYGAADATVAGVAIDGEQYALSATLSQGALSATGFYSAASVDVGGVTALDGSAIGLGLSYDLGGGAAIAGGVARASDDLANTDATVYDIGVTFSF